MVDFSPSIIAADLLSLAQEIKEVKEAPYLHIDIMDGHFVPNITIGPSFVEALKGETNQLLDVHLMIAKPDDYLETFLKAGADILTVHVETTVHLHRTLTFIKERGRRAGVALNPHTPIGQILEVLEILDVVLIMSVNPGFSGQAFIPQTLKKIEELHNIIESSGLKTIIEVDGGIHKETAPLAVKAGAQILVAGSSIFHKKSPSLAFKELQASVQ